jgi:hypothetical protein
VSVNHGLGRPRSYWDAIKRVRHHLRTRPIGTTVALKAYSSEDDEFIEQVRFRRISSSPPIADTQGVLGIDRAVGYIESKPEWKSTRRYAGICVCKPDSDHRDCAAIDVFASNSVMEAMRDVFLENSTWFNTKYVILYRTIFIVRNDGTWYSKPYTGFYHAHVHLSVNGGISGSAC